MMLSGGMEKIILKQRERTKIKGLMKKERDKKKWQRLKCLELKSEGWKHRAIAKLLDVDANTITQWVKQYMEEGLEGLCQFRYEGRRPTQFERYREEIKAYVQKGVVGSLGELANWLKETYGLECSENWLGRWVKKNSIVLTRRPG